jgi:hypothetical protein
MLTLQEKDKAYSIKEFRQKTGKCEGLFRQGAATHMTRGSGEFQCGHVPQCYRGMDFRIVRDFTVTYSTKCLCP